MERGTKILFSTLLAIAILVPLASITKNGGGGRGGSGGGGRGGGGGAMRSTSGGAGPVSGGGSMRSSGGGGRGFSGGGAGRMPGRLGMLKLESMYLTAETRFALDCLLHHPAVSSGDFPGQARRGPRGGLLSRSIESLLHFGEPIAHRNAAWSQTRHKCFPARLCQPGRR